MPAPNQIPPRSARRKPSLGWWLVIGAVIGVAALVVPFLIPVPRPKDTVEPEELADDDSRFTTIDGIRIHYKDFGPDDAEHTVVFLHGLASSLYAWRHAMAALCGRYRVIAFDRPGCGLSGRPLAGDWEGESPYKWSSAARQTIELMNQLGVKRAVLVGHSQGAMLSVLLAASYPDRVEGLVLANTPTATRHFRPLPDDILQGLRATPQIMHLAPLVPRPFFGKNAKAVMGLAYHDPRKLTDETVELELRATRIKDWDKAFVEFMPTQAGLHIPEAMAAVKAPTLVVAAKNDRTVPYRDQVKAARQIPGAHLITFDRTGHVLHEERAEEFDEVLEGFLETLDYRAD